MKLLKILSVAWMLSFSCGAWAEGERPFLVHAGAHWGLGKMFNTVKSIPQRTMNTLSVQALPALKFGRFGAGVLVEARRTGQNTEPAEVGNQNLGSTWFLNWLLGVGIIYQADDWKALASFDFLGRHKLDRLDTLSRESIYRRPRGFHLGGGYRVYDRFFADLAFSYHAYTSNSLGGVDNELTGNALKHWNLAAGISTTF